MRGRASSGGIGARGGDGLWGGWPASGREESLDAECRDFPKAPAMTSALRRVKLVKLEARLEVVDADQRLRLRRPSLRAPELLEREWPFPRPESASFGGCGGTAGNRWSWE